MTDTTLALTAPTGKIGQALLALAARRNIPVRALAREPSRLGASNAAAVRFDFADATTHLPALAGIHTLVLVSPASRELAAADAVVLDSARAAGVAHVVRLSAAGADDAATRFAAHHRDVEAHLRASGLAWTVVRPTFFMENLLALTSAITAGVYPAPIADARMTQVAVEDIAAVLLAVARAPERHRAATYALTASTADTGEEIAAVLAAATGHDVRYVALPEDVFLQHLRRAGLDEWTAAGVVEGFRKVRAGGATEITGDVQRVLGRAPTSFATWARERFTLAAT